MPRKGECMDLTGQKFGRWTVLEKDENIGAEAKWICICDCGTKRSVLQHSLRNGKSTSCGCYNRERASQINRKHGQSNKSGRLYPLWASMRRRCYSKKCPDYPNYGGRGIVICDEWKSDFTAFAKWAIENGYKEEKTDKGINILTIDRIDVNGNYEPLNCRFVTNAEQAKNKRNSMTDEERYRICPICGKKYEVVSRKGTKTCSQECGFKLREMENPRGIENIRICPICGKEFKRKIFDRKEQIYCSLKCMGISKSPIWEYNGERLRVIEWAEKIGISSHCLIRRKQMGWDIERILTTPINRKGSR